MNLLLMTKMTLSYTVEVKFFLDLTEQGEPINSSNSSVTPTNHIFLIGLGIKADPKAFAFSSSVKAKQLQLRSVEKEQCRLHIPTIDRSYGKRRRVQFVECLNDVNGMIDAAKFADLALILVDASYGFEMSSDLANFSSVSLVDRFEDVTPPERISDEEVDEKQVAKFRHS
ncbi:hypothetical protein Tsubulata_038474 [Turnera subulata]|uniref:Uncharacterized protein n=1 Tax=Turnera subulata TaxID=218843 RepID=A0A9Q0JLE6_9ROSI|nr:hypothetical protein Tsubulata_038474 [Turnera subulata]